jgi:two-component sensor histidine kinase
MPESRLSFVAERLRPLPDPAGASEADFVIAESNHRISNNLALLLAAVSIRANDIGKSGRSLDSEEVSLLLAEVGARISTVAWLHRFLSKEPNGEAVDLTDHLHELCETLISALSEPSRMVLRRIGDAQCVVASGQIVPLSLIVTEVVTNALKYAHPAGVPGKIEIGCRKQADGSLVVEIADDGVGLPEDFDLTTDGGIGARTIRVLARQLQAEFDFGSSPIGLRFTLCIPPARPAPHAA